MILSHADGSVRAAPVVLERSLDSVGGDGPGHSLGDFLISERLLKIVDHCAFE